MDKGKEVCATCGGTRKVTDLEAVERAAKMPNVKAMPPFPVKDCPDCSGKPEAGKEVKAEGLTENANNWFYDNICVPCGEDCSVKGFCCDKYREFKDDIEQEIKTHDASLLKEIVEKMPKAQQIANLIELLGTFGHGRTQNENRSEMILSEVLSVLNEVLTEAEKESIRYAVDFPQIFSVVNTIIFTRLSSERERVKDEILKALPNKDDLYKCFMTINPEGLTTTQAIQALCVKAVEGIK